ncbi:MAG: response regulator transcription factor [Prevotella sp.]|uniref:response regulator transcription factor n=1 Tax=Prevotella sp. Rep29 TaxID=2691580 RepID=UPI001B6C233F|nr:response regulator transcription factor [Prevotella sp. Rep29]MBP3834663.1 response regulator transcription factor [Prevotella sp.]MBQ3624750.1 response regulator transcription factor [Prevotella sp.]MBR3389770.1 response regulator transcription factor [Prevotella sp.]MBR3444534.1 response regulator transcription factor [Prevotella sp.]QYR10129.1 response regulator [Prevotella sp. Rep29]
MKILVIEDNREFRELLVHSLRSERYVVETAEDYSSACSKVFIYEYDCILLDIMLPDGNGLDLLREASRRGLRLNVIILSAKDSVEDKVAGLQLGADDYLPKPFHLSELHARIRSLLRRVNQQVDNTMQIANLSIDTASYTVSVDGQAIELGRKEYDILMFLINRQGRLVEKQTLAEAVWGDFIDQADNFDFIYAQMKNLRKRLKEAGAQVEIKTVYGFGYKLVVP